MTPGITFPIDQSIMFPFGCQIIEFTPSFQKWRSLGIILGAALCKSVLAQQEKTGAMIIVPTIVLRENLPTRAEL